MSPRDRITVAYGFAMPDDLFAFEDFAHAVSLEVLDGAAGIIALEGPFDLLRGEAPADPWWEARHYNDPPEFFTVMAGMTDGLHWGYYLDDPATGSFTVASYYSNDAFVLNNAGDTLFEALRYEMELFFRDSMTYRIDDPTHAGDYDARIANGDALRAALQRYATAERPETGEEYADRYGNASTRHPIAPTRDGMGIVAPPEQYRPLMADDPFQGWNYRPTPEDAREMTEAALSALAEGYPATALKLGKDLWVYGEHQALSYRLLDAAYAALDRPLLRHYLDRGRAHRAWIDAKRR